MGRTAMCDKKAEAAYVGRTAKLDILKDESFMSTTWFWIDQMKFNFGYASDPLYRIVRQ